MKTYKELLEFIGGREGYEVLERRSGYAHYSYKVRALTPEAKSLTAQEMAYIVDGGNLCFGGRHFSKSGDIFTGIVHTD